MTKKVKESDADEAARKEAMGKAWLAENRTRIDAHNARIEKHGTLITPMWLEE